MSRYIDADKLIKFANNSKDKTIDANDIARFPTADVVEVVRCRDCKWWRPFNDRMGHCGRGEMRHKDFYCQRGERADT